MTVASDRNTLPSGQMLLLLWQRKWFIAAVAFGALAFSGLLLALITPTYKAEALVALNTRPGQIISTATVSVAAPPPNAATLQTEIDVLRSRELAAQVVDELGLRGDPEFNSGLREANVVKRQAKAALAWVDGLWRQVLTALGVPGKPKAAAGDPAMVRTVEEVMERLSIKTDAELLAIHVSFSAEDARKAANIANAFVDIYVRNQSRTKFQEVERATGWIVQQIAHLRGELAQEADLLADFREKNQLAPNNDPSLLAAQELVALTAQISMVEKERVDAESALAETRRLLARGGESGGGAMDLIGVSPVLQVLRAKEADVRAQIADLSTRYRELHPRLSTLREQLGALQKEMEAEVAQGVQALSARVAQARSRETALRSRMRDVTQTASATNRTFSEVRLREKDIEAKNTLLSTFLARYNEIANRMEIERPDARIVSLAVPPIDPSYPKPLLFLGVAFTGALGLGMSLVLFLERFRAGFLNTRQVKQELGLPTVGIVPVMHHRSDLPNHILMKPRSVYTEAIKSAQLSVLSAAAESGSRRILVTSSVPGEGKTAFAISLARSLANNGYRTLLVDFDFRRPAVARRLGLAQTPGLADFLRQEAPIEDVIRIDERTGLHVAPAGGRADQDPQRLLNSHLMPSSLNAFMEGYEVVIVDSPPTMVASDAALLAKGCDFALYVVEWDKTPRHAVQAGVDYLQSMGGKVAGVVLSKVNFDKQKQHTDYVDFCFRYEDYYTK